MIDILIDAENNKDLNEVVIRTIENAINKACEYLKLEDDYEVSVSLVCSDTIKKLNDKYRHIDSVTDVLSFPLDYEFDTPIKMLGDIVINLDRVKEQAKEYGHSEERELSYLVVHSILHLVGYDHIEETDRKEMRAKEEEIMEYMGVKR